MEMKNGTVSKRKWEIKRCLFTLLNVKQGLFKNLPTALKRFIYLEWEFSFFGISSTDDAADSALLVQRHWFKLWLN